MRRLAVLADQEQVALALYVLSAAGGISPDPYGHIGDRHLVSKQLAGPSSAELAADAPICNKTRTGISRTVFELRRIYSPYLRSNIALLVLNHDFLVVHSLPLLSSIIIC